MTGYMYQCLHESMSGCLLGSGAYCFTELLVRARPLSPEPWPALAATAAARQSRCLHAKGQTAWANLLGKLKGPSDCFLMRYMLCCRGIPKGLYRLGNSLHFVQCQWTQCLCVGNYYSEGTSSMFLRQNQIASYVT